MRLFTTKAAAVVLSLAGIFGVAAAVAAPAAQASSVTPTGCFVGFDPSHCPTSK